MTKTFKVNQAIPTEGQMKDNSSTPPPINFMEMGIKIFLKGPAVTYYALAVTLLPNNTW